MDISLDSPDPSVCLPSDKQSTFEEKESEPFPLTPSLIDRVISWERFTKGSIVYMIFISGLIAMDLATRPPPPLPFFPPAFYRLG